MKEQQQAQDWNLPFSLPFSLEDGLSRVATPTVRPLSAMRGMYADTAAYEAMPNKEATPVYAFYELNAPPESGDLAFGTSITYPGMVGNEYFMTKGHFHTILETAEVYWCVRGEGYLLLESPEGDVRLEALNPGTAVYVPKRYAHRSINTGGEPMVTFFVFRADAGHDYGTIEKKGFRKLLVRMNGIPTLIDNPKWQEDPE